MRPFGRYRDSACSSWLLTTWPHDTAYGRLGMRRRSGVLDLPREPEPRPEREPVDDPVGQLRADLGEARDGGVRLMSRSSTSIPRSAR